MHKVKTKRTLKVTIKDNKIIKQQIIEEDDEADRSIFDALIKAASKPKHINIHKGKKK